MSVPDYCASNITAAGCHSLQSYLYIELSVTVLLQTASPYRLPLLVSVP